jgi:HK97 family phage major capsid protein
MTKQIKAKMEERARMVEAGRKLYAKVESEGRKMTAEEKAADEQRFTDIEEMSTEITRMTRQHELEVQVLAQAGQRQESDLDPDAASRQASAAQREHLARLLPLADRVGMGGFLRKSADAKSVDVIDKRLEPRCSLEYAQAFDGYLRTGGKKDILIQAALQADSNPAGGYLLAPMQMVAGLIKFVDDMLFIRRLATIFTITDSDSLGAAALDADPADAAWTSELGTGDEDSTMAFGKRELKPNPCAKRIKVSNKLLAKAGNAEGLVTQRLGYKFGVTQEKVFLTGSGASQPLGLFTASASGISTGRDVSTGATDGYTADGLIDAKYSLKGPYHANAQWLLPRTGVQKIAKLKDGNGQYLWQPSIQIGQPDRLLNFPINMSEHCPATFTTGLYVGMLADFSHYWIVDGLSFQIQRLIELYAATNQVGFIGRLEVDGMPVLEEAFARLKTA